MINIINHEFFSRVKPSQGMDWTDLLHLFHLLLLAHHQPCFPLISSASPTSTSASSSSLLSYPPFYHPPPPHPNIATHLSKTHDNYDQSIQHTTNFSIRGKSGAAYSGPTAVVEGRARLAADLKAGELSMVRDRR